MVIINTETYDIEIEEVDDEGVLQCGMRQEWLTSSQAVLCHGIASPWLVVKVMREDGQWRHFRANMGAFLQSFYEAVADGPGFAASKDDMNSVAYIANAFRDEPSEANRSGAELLMDCDTDDIAKHLDGVDPWPEGDVHDWRNYLPEPVREVWCDLTYSARLVAYAIASPLADSEEWE